MAHLTSSFPTTLPSSPSSSSSPPWGARPSVVGKESSSSALAMSPSTTQPALDCILGNCTANHSGQSRSSRHLQETDVHLGTITRLPDKVSLPGSSYANSQDALNDGAFGHPGVIIRRTTCGHLVFCLPVTSFGDATIQEKYAQSPNCKVMDQYLPLRRRGTKAHHSLPILDHSGPSMPKQSYVHLDHGYWIEWANLERFKGENRRLTQESYDTADRLSLELAAKLLRNRRRNGSLSPARKPSGQSGTGRPGSWNRGSLSPARGISGQSGAGQPGRQDRKRKASPSTSPEPEKRWRPASDRTSPKPAAWQQVTNWRKR